MKIRILRFSLVLLTSITIFISCKNDDDDGPAAVPPRDRAEQQLADKDSLITYLSTHYYNSSFFKMGSNHKYNDIMITELPKDNAGNYIDLPDPSNNTLLIDAVETLTTKYEDANYEYYILKLNQGGGNAPKFSDAVRVRYEGTLVKNAEVFDVTNIPLALTMLGNGITTFGTIRAWQLVMPTLNTALNFTDGIDGVTKYNDYGLGVMFVPSGLAYFSTPRTGIAAYSNLIFKFELLQMEEVDHDNDGVASYLEDLDNNLNTFDDDTDDDKTPNFIDLDDDNDEITTLNEHKHKIYIVDTNQNESEPTLAENEFEISRNKVSGVITIRTITLVDSNKDGIFDYLDANIAVDNNEFND